MVIKGGKWEMSDEEFEQQYAEATRRGKAETKSGAYAVAARYDKTSRRVAVDLATGTTLLVPARLIQSLQQATPGKLAEIEILGAGSGLYWPKLEIDIGVAGLLAGVFGTKAWMAELGRIGGQATSEAKRAASRINGRLGGRPRKSQAETNGRKRQRAA
ncbi:MAG: DUF2442 domain-containing protein [Blastocatellia bacterium]